jgi:hypothetical protein
MIDEEFRSLTPQIANRDEVALVGSTTLARQVTEFGAVVRPIPRWGCTSAGNVLPQAHPAGVSSGRRGACRARNSARARSRDCAGGVLPQIQMTEDGRQRRTDISR